MTRRYIMLLIGIFLIGTGISLIIRSGIGISPMSNLTNVMTQICLLPTSGMYMFLLNVLFFVGEFIVDFKSFLTSRLIQLIPTFFLSVAVDLNTSPVRGPHPEAYILKLAVLIIGCMFLGPSIAFVVSADVILMLGEALTKITSVKYQKEYGNVKTAVDVPLVVLVVTVPLIFLNTIYGVREGTLIAAFTIGNFPRFFRGYISKLVREVALQ